jgi:heme/copper-type cytochrome/quinol oxidase subunit 3
MSLLTSRDHALRIAVWAVIGSEVLMFAALVLVHGGPFVAPSASTMVFGGTVAVLLVTGGASLAAALRRTRDGQHDDAARMLAITAVVGFGALALELIGSRLAASTDPLAFAIIGLHAAHVGAGIALATWVLALVRCGRVHRRHHDVLALVATYWYFVAGVWMFVWPLVSAHSP